MAISETAGNGLLDAVRDRLRRDRKSRGKRRVSSEAGTDSGWGYDDMTPEEKALYDEERAAIAQERAEYEAEKAERESRRAAATDSLVSGDVFGGRLKKEEDKKK